MAFNPQHFGLYFTAEHVRAAQRAQKRAPVDVAFALLRASEQDGVNQAQWLALRWRFADDAAAGVAGAAHLLRLLDDGFEAEANDLDALQATLTLLHAFEMLRDHPALDAARCFAAFEARLDHLDHAAPEPTYLETLWRALLHVAGGVVLERAALFEQGAAVFRQVIETDIHPQGYILKAVDGGDGGSLYRQLMAVKALVLMAEAASHVGVTLWNHELRGVSAMTAVMYPVYYFFRPEEWKWDFKIDTGLFKQHGGCFEIAYRHNPLPDLKLLLDELRPVYDPAGGGLTTLTHGAKRGWLPFA